MGAHAQDSDELEVNALKAALVGGAYQLACALILNSDREDPAFVSLICFTRQIVPYDWFAFSAAWFAITQTDEIPCLCADGECVDNWRERLRNGRNKWRTLKNTTQP